MMDSKKKLTGMLIHGFAVAHAGTAAALSQTLVGDEIALTTLTIAMIATIARLNGANWNTGEALSFLGCFAGYYAGTRGATMLIKWVPILGNSVNAVVTFGVTEILGWATYLLISKTHGCSTSPKNTVIDIKELINEAKQLRDNQKKHSEISYESMSCNDKEAIDALVRRLKNKDISESESEIFEGEILEIVKKYN